LGLARGERHFHAVLGEEPCQGRAQAASGADDEGDFGHATPPWAWSRNRPSDKVGPPGGKDFPNEAQAVPMKRYSIFALLSHAISGHQRWPRLWPDPDPKPRYEVVIVGAGGHGLATAYYLAKEHGITDVAVLDKGWLGGGN